MNLFDEAREHLSVYEKERESLGGLDHLSMGIDKLVEIFEDDYADDIKMRAKNMLCTYRNNSLKWIEESLLVNNQFPSNLQFLKYCKPLLDVFLEIIEQHVGTDFELNSMKDRILTLHVAFIKKACEKEDLDLIFELVHGD